MLDTTGLPLDAAHASKELLNTLGRVRESIRQRLEIGNTDVVVTTDDLPGFWDDITVISKDEAGRVTVIFDGGETCNLEDLSPDTLIKIIECLDGM